MEQSFYVNFFTGHLDTSMVPINLLRDGYQSLWKAVSKNHDMRFGAKLSKVERNDDRIIIHQGDNTEEFDKLIVAFPINQFKELTNFTVDENYIARSVKFNPVWRLVFSATRNA